MAKKSKRLTRMVEWASFAKYPPSFAKDVHRRGARGRGVQYEKKVRAWLSRKYEGWYIPSPWLLYRLHNDSRLHWCQPDGLVIRPDLGIIWVHETKLRHTAEAWFQLMDLYLPILERIFPPKLWSIRLVEVVRWFDPSVPFPGKYSLHPEFEDVKLNEVGVKIWRK